MTDGQGDNSVLNPIADFALVSLSEPVRADLRVLHAQDQGKAVAIGQAPHGHQIARNFNVQRAVYQKLTLHQPQPLLFSLLANCEHSNPFVRNPKNWEILCRNKIVACKRGASYRTAPVHACSTFVPKIGQLSFAKGTQSARPDQRVGSASHPVIRPPVPQRRTAGALLSGRGT